MKDEGDTFMVDRVATIMADAECADKYVAGAAFHWYGANLKNYMDTYWAKAWGHFDVNQTGTIEVIKMPQFMRFLCSDQYMSLGESG